MLEWYTFGQLARMLPDAMTPSSILVHNLTHVGWWKEGEYPFALEDAQEDDDGSDVDYDERYDEWAEQTRPEGDIERHIETDRNIQVLEALQREADLCASVALEAIKAYRAYVANGGDPNTIPVLSFENGEFSVKMTARQKL